MKKKKRQNVKRKRIKEEEIYVYKKQKIGFGIKKI